MKKTISILTAVLLTLCSCAALAQSSEAATVLPCGVSFGMNMDEVAPLLGDGAERVADEIDPEVGTFYLETLPGAIGELEAKDVYFELNRSNSANAPRLTVIFLSFSQGENVIDSFRKVLEAYTSVYGAPDTDPFDENAVRVYQEFGYLSACWDKPEVRINLDMNRAYGGSINSSFSYLLNYDAADLK